MYLLKIQKTIELTWLVNLNLFMVKVEPLWMEMANQSFSKNCYVTEADVALKNLLGHSMSGT